MNVFGKLFIENAKCTLFVDGVANYQRALAERLSSHAEHFPERASRNITPSRPLSSIPPHIHDDNHTYEQEPGAKLSATIVGWREVKALTHYGVRTQHLSFSLNLRGIAWIALILANGGSEPERSAALSSLPSLFSSVIIQKIDRA